MRRLIIVGAGGYGKTIADIAEQLNRYDCICFLDDNSEEAIGKCVDFVNFLNGNTEFYPAFGNNVARVSWLEKLIEQGCEVPVLVHPTAYVSPKAAIDVGTAVLPGAIINTDCKIGRGCIVNCGAIIDHGCILDEGVHVCLGAIVKGENHLAGYMKVEAGEVVERRQFK